MGIIIKQSIKGSIWSYLGVAVGFITTAYLFPKYLTPDVVGLFGLLLAWSTLFAQFSGLGFNGVTSRLFPYFRDKEKGHNGFLFIALMVSLIGFILFVIVFWFLKPWLIESNLEKSELFTEYVDLLIPLTFFMLLYSFLDIFNKLLYDAVLGTFLTEFLQRFFILVVVLCFVFHWITLHQLVLVYTGVVSLKGLIIFIYLLVKGELDFRPQLHFIDKKLKKEIINVAVYSILAGIGGNIVFRIDKIIVNQMLGLSDTGVYSIAFYFGTLVVIPSRPLLRITGTLIADAWKRNDVPYISDIYKKSCINQFIIAAFLFGGIWVNIDSILIILGPEYAAGKWVIFFIGLGYLIDMATGANGLVISFSKYYRMGLWFLLILLVLVFTSMFLLIPVWGITGAAVAIALSFLINNIMRFVFLYRKYKMQPLSYHFLIVIIAFSGAYFIGHILPELSLIPDILVRSTIFTFVYMIFIVGFKISEDLNNTLFTIWLRMKRFLPK